MFSRETFSSWHHSCRKSLLQVDNHDGDVVQWSALIRCQGKAACSQVRLIQMVLHKRACLVVIKHVPEAVGGKNDKSWPYVGKIECQNIRSSDDDVVLFERVIAECSWHCEYADDTPNTVEHDKTSRVHYSQSLLLLQSQQQMAQYTGTCCSNISTHLLPRLSPGYNLGWCSTCWFTDQQMNECTYQWHLTLQLSKCRQSVKKISSSKQIIHIHYSTQSGDIKTKITVNLQHSVCL